MTEKIIARSEHEGVPVITINTALSPRSFAQSGLPRLITERGYHIHPDGAVTPWVMTGTRCLEIATKETMEFVGPDIEGDSLTNLIDQDSESAWKKAHLAFTRIHHAILSEKIPSSVAMLIAIAGPSAFFCGYDGSLLVLPPNLITRCVGNRGEAEEVLLRTGWIHPDCQTQDPLRSLGFMAGTVAYRIFSGTMPFQAQEQRIEEGIAGIQQLGIFEPLEYAAPTLIPAFTRAVDSLITVSNAASTDTLLAFGPTRRNL